MKPVATCAPPVNLWLDEPDAVQRIADLLAAGEITEAEADDLRFFREHGYLVLPGAVAVEQVDRLLAELSVIYLEGEKYVLKLSKDLIVHPDSPVLPHKSRLYDFHVHSAIARSLVFAEPLRRMLALVFAEPPLVFQSMVFTWGSEQSMHKDTAFVVVDRPASLLASWIALEDIEEGSGELMYYPGSHRDPLFLFSDTHMSWEPRRDGKGVHRRFTAFLDRQAAEKQVARQTFCARKGDVLLWHANLAHGGMPVTRPESTRKSLVSHYCPASASPRYFTFFEPAYKRQDGDVFYSSRRYDLRPGSHNPFPLFMG
ncbi:MAG TPA: phytanoyl-CoA dioxygenase family protein [Pseudomonadales bacterium]|nr:phytanoyl-CoA dioxygenase family protein [Pseudomonadales bacterium]